MGLMPCSGGEIEDEIGINYSKVDSLEQVEDFDFIIACDGFKSRIAELVGMREKGLHERLWCRCYCGWGLQSWRG